MQEQGFKCVKVVFSDYMAEIGALRRKAWEAVKGFDADAFPEKYWVDDLDNSSVHWAVFDGNKLIASARLGIYYSYDEIPYMEMMEPYSGHLKLPVASLNRLVVSTDYQGHNISQLLDKIRIEEAKKKGAQTIVGQAVSNRISCLQKLGLEYIADIGCIKELPNIELSLMVKKL